MNGLSLKALSAKTSSSKSYIYKELAAGRFPRPVKVGRRSVWIESEIDAWMLERISVRDGVTAEPERWIKPVPPLADIFVGGAV